MITDYKTYSEAKEKFDWGQIWDLFDGDREHFNIAHECIDRHPPDETAIRIKYADGNTEQFTFGEISKRSSQFAHLLETLGIRFNDRVAIMLEPCKEFYASLFGILKRGAIVISHVFPCLGRRRWSTD